MEQQDQPSNDFQSRIDMSELSNSLHQIKQEISKVIVGF